MTKETISMIRKPLPKQVCKIQNTNKKVYNRQKAKKERY